MGSDYLTSLMNAFLVLFFSFLLFSHLYGDQRKIQANERNQDDRIGSLDGLDDLPKTREDESVFDKWRGNVLSSLTNLILGTIGWAGIATLGLFLDLDAGYKQIACFDKKYHRDDEWVYKLPNPVTRADYCARFCGNFDYFGLWGNWCYCFFFGDRIENQILTVGQFVEDTADCDLNCVGNPKDKCGGNGKISIYKTDKKELLNAVFHYSSIGSHVIQNWFNFATSLLGIYVYADLTTQEGRAKDLTNVFTNMTLEGSMRFLDKFVKETEIWRLALTTLKKYGQ